MPRLSLRRRFFNWPLRRKMILGFLAVIGIGGIVSLLLGTRLEHRTIVSLAQAKVRHDLSSAWMVYNDRLRRIGDVVRLSAAREFLRERLAKGRGDDAAAASGRHPAGFRARHPDPDRRRRAGRPALPPAAHRRRRPVRRPVRPLARWRAKSTSGTIIVPREELLKEGSDLAERAYFKFVPTPMAALRPGDHEDSGMMLKAAAPVADGSGRILGVLYGGRASQPELRHRRPGQGHRLPGRALQGPGHRARPRSSRATCASPRTSSTTSGPAGRRDARFARGRTRPSCANGGRWIGPGLRRPRLVHHRLRARSATSKARSIGMLYVGMLEKPYIDLRNTGHGHVHRPGPAGRGRPARAPLRPGRDITRPIGVLVEATEQDRPAATSTIAGRDRDRATSSAIWPARSTG